MKIINKKVKHIVFGDGKVIGQETERITVQFSEQYGVKQFIYPDVFGKYLKLYDVNVETSVVNELLSKLVEIKDEKERKQQVYEENRADEKLKLEIEKKNTTRKRKTK
jgi:hypothetical protein